MKRAFLVVIEQPDKAMVHECISYIKDAVTSWRGQCRPPDGYDDPGDPMWWLEPNSVKVTKII